MFSIAEVDADGRMTATVFFDPDDLDPALAALDERYLVGEATAYARAWTVIAGATAAFNRHEPAPITSDCVVVDHRLQATIASGGTEGLADYLQASWDLTPDLHSYVETVHTLSERGALVTTVTSGTSADGFHAEWRQVTLMTVRGDLGDRCEIFDEAALGEALARFDELSGSCERHDENRPQTS